MTVRFTRFGVIVFIIVLSVACGPFSGETGDNRATAVALTFTASGTVTETALAIDVSSATVGTPSVAGTHDSAIVMSPTFEMLDDDFGLAPPYAAPEACAATRLIGPERRLDFPAYWLDGAGIHAGFLGVLFEGGNKVQWQIDDWRSPDLLTIQAHRQDGDGTAITIEYLTAESATTSSGAPVWPSWIEFSDSGCWQLTAVAGGQRIDATVYVYPSGCRPDSLAGMPEGEPAPCTP